MRLAQEKQPTASAEIIQLRDRTGLPEDLIERNIDEVRKQVSATDFDPEQFRTHSPIVAKWLAENPHHAAAAKDDYAQLGMVEWLLQAPRKAATRSIAQQDFGRLSAQRLQRDLTQEEREKLEDLRGQMQEGGDLGAQNFFSRSVLGAAEFIPQQIDQLAGSVKQVLYGANMGALSGALMGGMSGLLWAVWGHYLGRLSAPLPGLLWGPERAF